MSAFVFVAFMTAMIPAPSTARGADEQVANQSEVPSRAEFLVRGMLNEREKLVSAIVEVRGTKRVRHRDNKVDGAIRAMYAFDHSRGLLRFDSSEPHLFGNIGPDVRQRAGDDIKEAMRLADVGLFNILLRCARNADYSASWIRFGPTNYSAVDVRDPKKLLEQDLASKHHLFDLRACGVISYYEFESGGFKEGKTVKDYCEALLRLPVTGVADDGQTIRISLQSEFFDHELVVNERAGFCPESYTLKSRIIPGGVLGSRVEWTKVADVQVPTFLAMDLDDPRSELQAHFEYHYEWSHVNEPIDDAYFRYESFTDIPSGVRVVDMRKPGFPLIGIWKSDGVIVPEESPGMPAMPATGPPLDPGRRGFVAWLLVANLALLAAIIARTIYKRRRE